MTVPSQLLRASSSGVTAGNSAQVRSIERLSHAQGPVLWVEPPSRVSDVHAEVMDLVHDQEAEAISELVHVSVGALERHDGDALHRSMTVPHETDRRPGKVPLELLDPCDGERLGWTQNRRR